MENANLGSLQNSNFKIQEYTGISTFYENLSFRSLYSDLFSYFFGTNFDTGHNYFLGTLKYCRNPVNDFLNPCK